MAEMLVGLKVPEKAERMVGNLAGLWAEQMVALKAGNLVATMAAWLVA